jgi:hypothetical protein
VDIAFLLGVVEATGTPACAGNDLPTSGFGVKVRSLPMANPGRLLRLADDMAGRAAEDEGFAVLACRGQKLRSRA